jgi:hypothetical protein
MTRQRGIAGQIADYLVEHPNRKVSALELQRKLRLDAKQVSSATSYLVNGSASQGVDPMPGVERLQRGGPFRYSAEGYVKNERKVLAARKEFISESKVPRKKEGALYEEIGITHDGKPIVRSEGGCVFRLEPL